MRSVSRRNVAGGIVLVMALLPCALAAHADEIHVPADFPRIQVAINVAVDGDEVIIADGVYTGTGNRNIEFLGKAITVRSANGPENCVIDLEQEQRGFLFINGETNASVLDGLTVRNADIDDGFNAEMTGGAMLISDASPTISNCVFENNELRSGGFRALGGAIFSCGDPILISCIFDTNSVDGDNIASGGAFYNDCGSPQFFDCHFQNNSCLAWPGGGAASGGAIGGEGSVTLTGCTFVDNDILGDVNATGGAVATDRVMAFDCYFEANGVMSGGPAKGGAIAVTDESSQVINCSFFNNDAISCCVPAKGGAINGPGTLLNSLFVGNVADNGGGYAGTGSVNNCTFVANEAGIGAAIAGAALVSNSIAWNNIGNPIDAAQVTYSNIQGGYDGEGNIDADPMFADAVGGDYRLSSGSPSIDAGSNDAVACAMLDLDGNERFADDLGPRGLPAVDMGAYEFASSPADGGADCNRNGLDDACELAAGFTADCNGNGVPDSCDIAGGISEDCNLDGAPDECSDDCNNNGLPDVCEVVSAFTVASAEMSPIGDGVGAEFVISMPPEAVTDVTLTFRAQADLNSFSEFISVRLNDVLLGTVFEYSGFQCDDISNDTLVVSADAFNDPVNGGDALLTMTPSEAVAACGGGSWLMVTVDYLMPDPDTDADGNGIPDECETLGDLDGDGVVGPSDLIALLGAWGACDDCDNCAADLDGDCDVDGADLILLLGNWG